MENFEKKVENQENILKKLKAEKPEWDVAFTAIEKLKDGNEIKEFFNEYVEYLKDAVEKNPEAAARQNIGYTIGYFDKETAERWMNAIPEVSHPVVGKEIPEFLEADQKRAFETGEKEEK